MKRTSNSDTRTHHGPDPTEIIGQRGSHRVDEKLIEKNDGHWDNRSFFSGWWVWQDWLILSRLALRPSTNNSCISNIVNPGDYIGPLPMILEDLPSQKVTFQPLKVFKFVKIILSPLIYVLNIHCQGTTGIFSQ